jgi:hypothetical protein
MFEPSRRAALPNIARFCSLFREATARVRMTEAPLFWTGWSERKNCLPEGPRTLLKKMIAEGRLGVKSGRGFYDYQ